MNSLEEKIQAIAEYYSNDLSAFLHDAYSSFAQDKLTDENSCQYDYSWCVAKRHGDKYCFYHWLIESLHKERENTK